MNEWDVLVAVITGTLALGAWCVYVGMLVPGRHLRDVEEDRDDLRDALREQAEELRLRREQNHFVAAVEQVVNRCQHEGAVPVKSVVHPKQVLAYWCAECETQLEPDHFDDPIVKKP